MKKLVAILLLFYSIASLANTPDLSQYFQNKSGCFILYDLNQDKTLLKYNVERCAQRISPNDTFTIALSLMALDQKLINPKTIDVSPNLVKQLGESKINYYLKKFNYGNEKFTDLKISADEQLTFLKSLAMGNLPASNAAMLVTKSNMHLESLANGWELFGVTGSGFSNKQQGLREGWFIGYLEKGEKLDIFALNFTDLQKFDASESAGVQAKRMAQDILKQIKFDKLT